MTFDDFVTIINVIFNNFFITSNKCPMMSANAFIARAIMPAALNILVADDFSTMRRIVGGLLRQCGATRIFEAEDGVEALRIIENNPIDSVASDWNMPNMTGLDLLKTLRAHPKFARMPVLLITAEGKKENIVEAAQAGADGYIVKPFTQDTLQEKLTRILSRHAAATT